MTFPGATPLPGPAPVTGAAPRRPGPPVWLGVGLLVVAVAAGIASIIGIVASFRGAFGGPILSTPGSVVIDADDGAYAIYELVGRTSADDGTFVTTEQRIRRSNVRVTGPDGAEVPVATWGQSIETIGRNGRTFRAAVRFTVDRPGRHTVEVTGTETEVVVAPTLGSSFGEAGVWLLALFGAAVVFLAGGVLLIVTAVRRRAARRAAEVPPWSPVLATPAAAAPAGWYPDPSDPGLLRYHDGRVWTGHTRPRTG